MFNFNPVNTAEVNAGSSVPLAPVLSILVSEDTNSLSWNSPYSTDFFKLYWSADPFTSITDPGVHEISTGLPSPQADIVTLVTYTHSIPPAFSLTVLYYRVLAFNRNGGTLSNEVNNYNFRLAIYEDIYNKTLEDLTLRFTPEIRKQYEDSQLWRSFVQSLCSELAQSRFSIKEALKQLNLQKAVEVFLSMWRDVIGVSKENVIDVTTGLVVPETDAQYRQRLVDNVFWDKISNLALKKTMLLKIGYEADVLDNGVNADIFRVVPTRATTTYTVTYGNVFIPGELVYWLRSGPNSYCTCVSDTGSATITPGTLTYSNYDIEAPLHYQVYGYFGANSWMGANPLGEPIAPGIGGSGSLIHDVIQNPFAPAVFPFTLDEALTFAPSGATGIFKSDVSGVLTFELTYGSVVPQQYDIVSNGLTRVVLTALPAKQTAAGDHPVNSKLLSNTYSVSLGVSTLTDASLNTIYDNISKYGSIGNVLTKIIQDVSTSFNDWNETLGSIPYGAIFMQAPSYGGLEKDTDPGPGVLWSVGEVLYLDNGWTASSGKTFYGNDGPDDIALLTRTS